MEKKEPIKAWRPAAWKPLYVIGSLVILLTFVGSCGLVLFALVRGGDTSDEPVATPLAENAEELVSQGIDFASEGNFTRALEDFAEAIRLDPNLAGAYYNRGITYNKLGRFQEALQDLSQAIILAPENGAVYANRAFTYTMLGLDTQASKDVELAVANGVDRENLEQQIRGARKARDVEGE